MRASLTKPCQFGRPSIARASKHSYRSRSVRPIAEKPSEAAADDVSRLPHDALNELGHCGDVANQTLHLPCPNEPSVQIASFEQDAALRAPDQVSDVLEPGVRTLQDFNNTV